MVAVVAVVAAAGAAAAAVVVVVIGICSPLVCFFAGVVVVGVCSPLVLLWLVGGGVCSPIGVRPAFVHWHGGGWRLFAFCFGVVGLWSAFSRLWCEVSVCSLAWWWLAFVRLWFWRGWLVVAFARLWWPRVCSLGRWLASVCLGSVIAAGFVVACHGYAA